MELILPWPPSVNHYYRNVRGRTLISREGRAYRKRICNILLPKGASGGGFRGGDRIALAMDAFPPDRRRRDLDNLQKGFLDALGHAGIYEDDSKIDFLSVSRCEPVRQGRIEVRMETFPLCRCPLCGRRFPVVRLEAKDNKPS